MLKLTIEIVHSGYTGTTLLYLNLGNTSIYKYGWDNTVPITKTNRHEYPFESDSVQEAIKEFNSIKEAFKYSFGIEGENLK